MFVKMRWVGRPLTFQEIFKTNKFKLDGTKDISKLLKEKLETSVNNVLMESGKRRHRSVTAEIGKEPLIASNLMTVKNIFIIADSSNITKCKRKFQKL